MSSFPQRDGMRIHDSALIERIARAMTEFSTAERSDALTVQVWGRAILTALSLDASASSECSGGQS